MKKTTLALGSTIACLFLLAACTDATTPSTSSTSTTKTTTQTSTPPQQVKNDQSASLTIGGTEQSSDQTTKPVLGETTSSQSQSDIVAQRTAMELSDTSYCEKIQDEKSKKECNTNVTDKITLTQAINKLDSSICNKLSTENLQVDCMTQVEVSKKKSNEESMRQSQNEKSNDVIASGDYTRCAKELTDPIFVNNCEMNILYSKAINSRDISYCKKISDSATEQNCEQLFNSEPKPAPAPTN